MRMRKYWKNVAVGFLAIAIVFTMPPVDNPQVVSAATDVKINSLATDIGNGIYNQEGTGDSGGVNSLNGSNDVARTDTKLFSPKVVVNQTGYGSVDLSWDNYYDVNDNAIQYDKNFVINVSEDNKNWNSLSLDYRDIDQVNLLQIFPNDRGETVGVFNEMNYWLHTIVPAMDDSNNFLFKNSSGKLVYVPANTSFYGLTCGQLRNYTTEEAWTSFFNSYAKSSIGDLTPMFTTIGTGNKYYADFSTVKSYIDNHTFSNGSVTVVGSNYATGQRSGWFKSEYLDSSGFMQLIQPDSVYLGNFNANPWYYLRSARSIKHALAYYISGSTYHVYWSDGSCTTQSSVPDGSYSTYVTSKYSPYRISNGFGPTSDATVIGYNSGVGITWYVNNEDAWRYDVTLTGLVDGGIINVGIGEIASSALQCSILSGHGHYMGHDDSQTDIYQQYVTCFCGGYQSGNAVRTSSETIYAEGLITQYPWYLGSIGTKLPIGYGHTWHWNLTKDTKIWTYLNDGSNRPFTFTRNNCGIVNTGDYGAQVYSYNAIPFSEAAVIANMGFYCKQLIFNKYDTSDATAVDKTAPSVPVIGFTNDGWKATSSDTGNVYYYRVQSYDKDHGSSFDEGRSSINNTDGKQDLSTTVKVDVQTGVRKYVYTLDNNPNTVIKVSTSLAKDNNSNDKDAYKLDIVVPEGCIVTGAVDITDANSQYDYLDTTCFGEITGNGYRYIHVIAIDGAGNVSETATSELTREYKVLHQLEQLDVSYVTKDTDTVRGIVGQTIVPQTRTYKGYDTPALKTILVDWTTDGTIIYQYQLHHYKLTYDTQGGEWYEEQSDGTWISVDVPPSEYTVLTPDIHVTKPDKVGYTFLGWTGTDVPSNTLDVVIPQGSLGDRSYTAHWEAQAYDVEVPVSVLFSVGHDGYASGVFDQKGDGNYDTYGYLNNNSLFPVQVTNVTFKNESNYVFTHDRTLDETNPNIMNWRLDIQNGGEWNQYAPELLKGIDTDSSDIFWMAQNGNGHLKMNVDNAWAIHNKQDVKEKEQLGRIVWTFGIGHRNVTSRSITTME